MGKLPAFQFYPGDWLQDNVAGCSLAAQGLWLRMMFIMHSAERRGYLSMNGRPMPDDFIASKCGADVASYRSLLAELFTAGVPRKTSDGVIYNERMVRDERVRQQVRQRVVVHRAKRNGDVTPVVTQVVTQNERRCTEDEDENEVEVGFDLEAFDHEKAVREIQSAHPRPENSQANEIAILEALEYVTKSRQCKRQEAAEWLLSRTEMYGLATEQWPEKKFITKSTRWFTSRSFEEDPAFWERKNGNGKQDFSDKIRGAVQRMADEDVAAD